MSYRDRASFGKRQEHIIIAELLKRNFDVYRPEVDDQGIDCVIRLGENTYLEIQIKTKSKNVKLPRYFAGLKFEPRDNYFFIFYPEADGHLYILPSKEVEKRCSKTVKDGKYTDQMSITIPNSRKLKEFEQFKDKQGFELLKKYEKQKSNDNL